MSQKNWVCATNTAHTYNSKEAEDLRYFCNKCPYGEGILIEDKSKTQVPPEQRNAPPKTSPKTNGSMDSKSFADSVLDKFDFNDRNTEGSYTGFDGRPSEDLGLAIILVDCSGSMRDPAFPGNPLMTWPLLTTPL